MIDNRTINELSEKINALLPPGLQQVKADFDERLKILLQQQLAKYDMVSREEFDIQTRVLERTRAKLEAVETRLEELVGKPVVASDTALYWRLFKTLGIAPMGRRGQLLTSLQPGR